MALAVRLAEEQITDWSARWMKATRDAPVTFEEAWAVAAAFLNPVLDGTADGMRWNAATRAWA